jgi:2-succinyl-5-enolpyruvyl-6-hydroxy-3-cyclohexene-1-carboxylate synthase
MTIDPGNPVNPSMLAARLVVEELHRKGLRLAVLCPGSRNSPLLLALAGHGGFRLHSVIDERAAAFVALGWARACGEPALVCTTSGSAVAHLLPAAVEADQDSLPLLLLCADRPPELRDTGSNQTLDHAGLLGGVLRACLDLPEVDPARPLDWLLSAVDEAVDRCRGPQPGPVLLNLPFRKPLENRPAPVAPGWSRGLEPWLVHRVPWRAGGYGAPDTGGAGELAAFLAGARRPLLLLGRFGTGAQAAEVARFAQAAGLPLVADLLSGIGPAGLCESPGTVIQHGDLLAALDDRELARCDRVIQLGGRLASPALLDWLGQRPWGSLALLEPAARRLDPAFRQSVRLTVPPDRGPALLEQAWSAAGLGVDPDWCPSLAARDARVEQALIRQLDAPDGDSPAEAFAARLLSRLLPPGHDLWVASSSPVRDLARWGTRAPASGHGSRGLWCNRGASGIDGTLACALGACLASGNPLTVHLGDLALIHDLNSLVTVARSGAPLTVLLVNNDGGGIFRRLPVSAEPLFHPWIDTPHGLDAEALCAAVGLPFTRVSPGDSLESALVAAWASGKPALVEVISPRGAASGDPAALLARLAAGLDG